jgi:hypothetical protein
MQTLTLTNFTCVVTVFQARDLPRLVRWLHTVGYTVRGVYIHKLWRELRQEKTGGNEKMSVKNFSSIESEKSSFESEKSREARGEAAVTGAGTAGRRAQTRAGHGHGLGEAPVGRTGFCRRPALHARS